MVLSPRESGKFIASSSRSITVDEKAAKNLAEKIAEEIISGRLSPSNFSQNDIHPKYTDPKAIDWIFVVDTLNFCFWKPENDTGWKVEGQTGYFALCAAINRAQKENIDILNPKFYSTITEEKLSKILRSDTDIKVPLLPERLKCLHQVGACLLEKFEGSFENCVKQCDNSAIKLLHLIVKNFECFRDEAEYKGRKVALYKRAQILVGDIWACFKGEGLGYFSDIDEITMFADYRVPQTLLYFGVLKYDDCLSERLRKNELMQNGEEDEVEIRGCSIHAVEIIVENVREKLPIDKSVNSVLVDHFLWDFRRKNAAEILEKVLPFHKTYSIYY